MTGNCYDLVTQYLQSRNKPYIVSRGLDGMSCSWNFSGNVYSQFLGWCKRSGLTCGGSPFYVGRDSSWYQGQYMDSHSVQYMETQKWLQERKDSLAQFRLDSVANLPPELLKHLEIDYLQISKSDLEKLGFSWSNYVASFSSVANWSLLYSTVAEASIERDTSLIYRHYEADYDSVLSMFWGGEKDVLTSSNVTSSGIVSNNYETKSFGLTFSINLLDYSYIHNTDDDSKISGSGHLKEWSVNTIKGTYDQKKQIVVRVPFFSAIPWLGELFTHTQTSSELILMVIRVRVTYPSADLEDLD